MKKIIMVATLVYAILIMSTCATGGTGVGGTVPLDQAIREAAQNIENNVAAGRKLRCLTLLRRPSSFPNM